MRASPAAGPAGTLPRRSSETNQPPRPHPLDASDSEHLPRRSSPGTGTVRGEGEEREAPGSPEVARGDGEAPRSSRGGGEARPAAARWAPPGFVGNATRLQQPPQLREETALSGARLSRGQPQHRGRECRRPAPTSSRYPPSTAGPALSSAHAGKDRETEKKGSQLSYPAPLTGPPSSRGPAPTARPRCRLPGAQHAPPGGGPPRPPPPLPPPLPREAPPRQRTPEDLVPGAGTSPTRPVPEGFTEVPRCRCRLGSPRAHPRTPGTGPSRRSRVPEVDERELTASRTL
ncbi:basic proline-rich protein-like [Lagopus leucura]|uniref:basic proline-rich protein-like n=1 Tax=Lagopus leucura TaxID=30410 RepID=UPI001C66F926|nr:basic proline-rich protein-like [Lagopus leucura]